MGFQTPVKCYMIPDMAQRPFDHIDTVLSGVFTGTAQTWSCTVTSARTDLSPISGSISVGDLNTAATNIASSLATVFNTYSGMMGNDCKIAFVRNYLRPANTRTAIFVGEAAATLTGSNVPATPYQCALVATLLTGAAGRANRGRLYLPFTKSNRQAGSTDCSGLAGDVADYIAKVRLEISAIAGGAAGPVVGNNGLLVNRIRVDSVVDTQRRRRDKIVPVASSAVDVPVP